MLLERRRRTIVDTPTVRVRVCATYLKFRLWAASSLNSALKTSTERDSALSISWTSVGDDDSRDPVPGGASRKPAVLLRLRSRKPAVLQSHSSLLFTTECRDLFSSGRRVRKEGAEHGLRDRLPRSGAGMAVYAVRQTVFLASGLRRPSECSRQGPDEEPGRRLTVPDMSNRVPLTGAAAATAAMGSAARNQPMCFFSACSCEMTRNRQSMSNLSLLLLSPVTSEPLSAQLANSTLILSRNLSHVLHTIPRTQPGHPSVGGNLFTSALGAMHASFSRRWYRKRPRWQLYLLRVSSWHKIFRDSSPLLR